MKGKLLIFSAPSGSGKTTIVRELLKHVKNIEFSVSATSRTKREGEIHAKDYYFLSEEEFKKRIENEEFLEWEEVYKGTFYGTLKSEIDRIWATGNHVIFDVDVVGGVNIKSQFGDKAFSIFIKAPSVEVLKQRLTARSTDSESSIKKRLDKAEYELGFAQKFDEIIINDKLEVAVDEAIKKVRDFLMR